MKAVLVVSDRHSVHQRFRKALHEDGWDVFDCPGPPYCTSEDVCPLSKEVDVVILDTDFVDPVRPWLLLTRYRLTQRLIVVLARPDESPIGDMTTTIVLTHNIDAKELVRELEVAMALRHDPSLVARV